MSKAGKIISISPRYAIAQGEILIQCEGFRLGESENDGVYFDGLKARLIGASESRILAIVPDGLERTQVEVWLETDGQRSEPELLTVGKKLADDLHLVANPAVDPKDDSIILTRSGSRGQHLPVTLFRLEDDSYLTELKADVKNPTGIAFNRKGQFFVTNRADGEVLQIERDEEQVSFASGLGIATGIAFNNENLMFVGDRSGNIFRVSDFGNPETFATLEPSVSAYHLAFGPDGRLFVTAPGLSSHDAVYAIDESGFETKFFKGLGRPQGLAFDRAGNLYAAACYRGGRGIVKISPDGERCELLVAGGNVVGLCFTRRGEMIVATNEAVFSLNVGIYGTLIE